MSVAVAAGTRVAAREEAGSLEPGADHYVWIDGTLNSILLPRFYPSELALERARRAFWEATLRKHVEMRRGRTRVEPRLGYCRSGKRQREYGTQAQDG